MSASHTPGPWSVPHFAEPDVNCECGYVLTDHLMGAVCTVHASGEGDWREHGDNPKFAEAVANARLIAQAPAFFASAKSLVEAWDARTTVAQQIITGKSDRDLQKQALDAIEGLRVAIAKATGAA